MLRYFFTLAILTISLIRPGVFTLVMLAISPSQTSTTKTSSIPCAPHLGMVVCGIDSAVFIHSKTNAYKIHKRHLVCSDELKDLFNKWTLQLFGDLSNTQSYACRYLVKVAGLSDGNSHQEMMQAHKHGDTVIGEHCQCQDHAEHYIRKL